jgi:hypothetical protein
VHARIDQPGQFVKARPELTLALGRQLARLEPTLIQILQRPR